MEYEGQICRPPMERASFMLPVAAGCSYNRCAFCTLFKHLKFRQLPLSEVEAELKRVRALGGSPRQVFLGDGNPFAMDTERLLAVLSLIRSYFPDVVQVNMDATVTSIAQKSDAELRQLFDAGVRMLYLGIESGLPDVLEQLKKDHSPAEARVQTARLHAAGIAYGAHIMLGTAGRGRGAENAEATAEFLNETHPERVINTSIFLHKEAPLYREIEAGRFLPASELENLWEEYRLLERCTAKLSYDGFHDLIEVRTRGVLPRDKAQMLAHLREAIAREEKRRGCAEDLYNVPVQHGTALL